MYTSARSRNEFWKIPLDGGPTQEILRDGAQAPGRFTWSDDKRIVSDVGSSETGSLAVTDLASGARRAITNGASRDLTPAVSPDGGTLAFASGDLGHDIVEVRLDGSAPRDVIANARSQMAPTWAPDGIRFAYATDRSGAPEIWLRNRADGSERLIAGPQQLPELIHLLDCEISPDGSRVAYRARSRGQIAIWISPLSGDTPVGLWDDPAKSPQRGPSWSPDGNWIAYYGARDGRSAVMKVRVGSGAPAEFLAAMARIAPVRWSPRGDWIAYRDGEALRIVSPDGQQNRTISRRMWHIYGWSKDGAALYGIVSGENRRLWLERIEMAVGKETQIADLGPVPAAFDFADTVMNDMPYRGFSMHPDGKSFLTSVVRTRTQIYLMKDFDRTERLVNRWWRRP